MRKLLMAVVLCVSGLRMCWAYEDLRLGNYVFNPERTSSTQSFTSNVVEYGATVSYTKTDGYTIMFSRDVVIDGRQKNYFWFSGYDGYNPIFSHRDVKIILPAGVDVVLESKENAIEVAGNLTIEGPGSILAASPELVMGISCSKTLKIIGAPAINISSGSRCIHAGEDIAMDGVLLTCLGHGANLVEASGNIRILASMLNLTNGIRHIDDFGNVYDGAALYASGNIDITASVLTINSCAYGIEAYGESINLNYVAASIVSYQECVRNRVGGAMSFSHVNLNAASKERPAISSGNDQWYGVCDYGAGMMFFDEYDDRHYDDLHYKIVFGDGKYMLYSPMYSYDGRIGVAAIWCQGRVILSGGDVKCCAPRGNLVYTGEFEMTGGSLQPVKTADFASNCKMIMGEAAVSVLMAGSGIWNGWTGTQAAFLTIMGNQLIDMLPESDEGWPKAIVHAQEFRQTGGEVIQGESDYGYFSDVSKSVYSRYSDEEIARYVSTPILAGGSFNGYFFAHGWYDSYDPEPSFRGREFYRPISPVDASGRFLTHVDYSPYWEYRGTPANTDLSPCTPPGWSGPLVVSKKANDLVGTTQFSCEDDIYVSFAVLNEGADLAAPFVVSIYIDGMFVGYQECASLRSNYYMGWPGLPIGKVGAGNHRMVMSVDDLGDVAETDEDNNLYFVDFSVVDNRAKVSFDPQGGVVDPASVVIRKGGTVGTLPTPTRSKYKFNGWYTAAEGGTKISSTTKVTTDVTYYAHWTYDGSATVAVDVGRGCAEMGSVSGGKTAKAGTKLTLKATAKKGYVFAGWYRDAAGEKPVEGGVDYRSPSYTYVVGEDDATFYAKFIPVDEDWVGVWCQPQNEYVRGGEIAPLAVVVDSASLATVKVTGLPTGLKFTAKPLVLKATNNREAEALPANTIYGTPTKSGIYTATITVTTAGKKSETYKVDFVVRGEGEYLVDVMGLDGADYPTNGSDVQHAIQWGKMSGYGVFKPNKTATLKATANKGYVFAGWFSEVACVCEGGEEDDGCVYTPAEGTVDYRSTSFPVKVGYEDVLYYARFVRAEDDDKLWANVEDAYYLNGAWSLKLDIESRSLPTVTVKGLPSGLKFNSKTLTISGTPTKPGTYSISLSLKNKTIKKAKTQSFVLYVANIESPYLKGINYANDAYVYRVGTSMEFDIGSCATDGYSVTGVNGLPSGLKFDKKTGFITGVPTKSGAKTVTITLKNGKLTSSATITFNVDAIDTWAYGTFNGGGETGVLTLTVGNTGKISGKWMTVDGTWTLSAKSYESYDEQGCYCSLVAAKCGAQTAHFWLDAYDGRVDIYEYLPTLCGYGPLVATAKRNAWKEAPRKALAAQMKGVRLALTDEVSLKVGTAGAVTATGKFVTGQNAKGNDIVYSASCSTVLVPVAEDVFKLYLCFPKKNGKFDGVSMQAELEWDGSALSKGCDCREGF